MVDTTIEKQTGAEDVIWDLSEYFAGVDDPLLDESLARLNQMGDDFVAKYRGKIAQLSAQELHSAFLDIEAMDDLIGRIYNFAYLNFAVQSTDPKWGVVLQKVTEANSQLSQKMVFFELEWLEVEDECAQALMNDPILNTYRHQLEAERRYKPHRLSEAEEKILIEKSVTGRSAWGRFFEQVVSSMMLDWEGEQVPFEQVLSKLTGNPDRDERRRTAEAVTAGLNEKIMELTYIFNTIAADKASDDRLRNYPSWIASRYLSDKSSPETAEALIHTVTDHYHLVARHYTLKKKLLGYDELFDYDRYAPLNLKESDVFYKWKQAQELVLAAFKGFEPRMSEIAAHFFEKKWIHAPVAAGKQGGAFCMRGTKSSHPWVMLNYVGTVDSVTALAHELGHGIHSYLTIENQSTLNMNFTTTTAEIASIFAEMIVFQDLMAKETDKEIQLAMLTDKIDGTIATVFRQIAFNRFEDALHNARRSEGELTTERFNELWMQSQYDMFQGSVTMRDEYSQWWGYVGHFIRYPGYVYAYAFGELLTLALYNLYEQQGDSFIPQYIELLSAGGNDYPDALLAKVGVDLSDPNFWNEGLALIEKMIEQEEVLAKALYPGKF